MKKQLGLIGEKLAAKYLMEKNYVVLEKNYRTKLGEIDIIAKKDNCIIFIEVKTRTSNIFGTPGEAVNYKKQMVIRKLSQQYILYKKLENKLIDYRYDVIEVRIRGKRYKVNHIENAFGY